MQSWPEGGPKRVWLYKNAGGGYSGPAVVGDRLYILGTRDDKEVLLALSAKTGKEAWVTPLGKILTSNYGNGPRSTPAVDGDRVYAFSSMGTIACIRATSGQIVWKKTMQELGGSVPRWYYATSPLVDGNKVICTPGGTKGCIAALDKMTGEVVWQSSEFTDAAQYASIIAIENGGTRQYVHFTLKHLVGVAADNGRLLWQSDWPGQYAVVATPIYHDGKVYVSSGYGAGCKLVEPSADGKAKDIYANKVMKNHHGGVILVDGHLYGYSNGGGWTCQNFATGKSVWNEKGKFGKGSIAYADGRFYLLQKDSGTVVLIDASPEGWNERGRFKIDPQSKLRKPSGRVWTHPVITAGRMYLRDQEYVYCYDVSAG